MIADCSSAVSVFDWAKSPVAATISTTNVAADKRRGMRESLYMIQSSMCQVKRRRPTPRVPEGHNRGTITDVFLVSCNYFLVAAKYYWLLLTFLPPVC